MIRKNSIPVTINGCSLTKVKAKRVLGIIIDEGVTFTSHVEHITQKCKRAYKRLTLYPELSPHLAFQLCKAFIRSNLNSAALCGVFGYIMPNT